MDHAYEIDYIVKLWAEIDVLNGGRLSGQVAENGFTTTSDEKAIERAIKWRDEKIAQLLENTPKSQVTFFTLELKRNQSTNTRLVANIGSEIIKS